MKFGIVGRITDGFFRYQGWPTVVRGEDGTLYAASSGHRLAHVCPFGKNLLYISRDEGETWEGPTIINDTYMDDRDAGLCAWGKGNLLLSWFSLTKEFFKAREETTPLLNEPLAKAIRDQWETLPAGDYDPGAFVKLSQDGGKTWGKRVRVPVTAPHGPIRKKDGHLLFFGKAYLWEDKDYKDGYIYAVESSDDGQSWQKLGEVPLPQGIMPSAAHEPYAVELPDGTLLGAIRIHGEQFEGKITTFLTRSTDGGVTWSEPQELKGAGFPPHLLQHSSGALVMTYGIRDKKRVRGEYAIISRDGGLNWSEPLLISEVSPVADLGYPSSAELSDGSVITVYYQRYGEDPYNSILYTKWSLPE